MRTTDKRDDDIPLGSFLQNDLRVTSCDDLRILLGSDVGDEVI